MTVSLGWTKRDIYELSCLVGIACCMWLIGDTLNLFPTLQRVSLEGDWGRVVLLGFFMSFALVVASALKSVGLRREIRARQAAEADAQSIARHDMLTGLANRRMLIETIQGIADRGGDRPWALLLVDLDRFKPVNDIHGHAAGDVVLREVAERLKATAPPGAIVGRLGGDEFALLVPADPGFDFLRLAQRLISEVSAVITWQHARIDVGATIGIALWPQDGRDPEALLRSADIAMYRGKREGRNTFRFFEQTMDEDLKARVSLETALRQAIQCGDIRPHYQPLVALPGHELLGFEVLARWYHPERGLIAPDAFIPIAEDTGLISDLSDRLLRQACHDAATWPEHLTLSINIAPCQFRDRLLGPRILNTLREAGFSPKRLEVEITESALMKDLDVARATLSLLQGAGVSIALDDFGTGYSSLYHLREMRFDKIKIDRSFVQSLGDDDESEKIIGAILGLGQSLGIVTTAEGIETLSNSTWLAERGCTYGQGYLFGRAIPADAVQELIREHPAGQSRAA